MKKHEQGIATLLTLLLSLFLSLFIAAIGNQVRTELDTGALSIKGEQAEYMAQAGVQVAFAEIMAQPQNFRSNWTEAMIKPIEGKAVITVKKNGYTYSIQSIGYVAGARKALTAVVEMYPETNPRILIQHQLSIE